MEPQQTLPTMFAAAFLTIAYVAFQIIIQHMILMLPLIDVALSDKRRSGRLSSRGQADVAGDTPDTEESQHEPSVTRQASPTMLSGVTVPDDSDDETLAGAETGNNEAFESLRGMELARKVRAVYGEFVAHHLSLAMDAIAFFWLLYGSWRQGHYYQDFAYDTAISICQYIWFARVSSALLLTAKELAPRIRSVGCVVRALLTFPLQLLDFHIILEIYQSRKKVTSKNEQIKFESSLNFRYIRTMQAIFQSVPSALMLLRYVLISGHIDSILIVSIACSIWSITSSTLNEDNAWMIGDEWRTHKRRLPPSWNFLKHALCRMSEVTYRLVLLALIWAVCGEPVFGLVFCTELLCAGLRSMVVAVVRVEPSTQNGAGRAFDCVNTVTDSTVRAFRSLVIVPSEEMYHPQWKVNFDSERWEDHIERVGGGGNYAIITALYTIVHVAGVWLTCGCCAIAMIPMFCKAWCCRGRFCREKLLRKDIGWVPLLRMSASFWEFAILIVYGMLADEDEDNGRLFDTARGIRLLIVAIICYLFNSQYLAICPPFALPFGIGARSRWGYAYAGELAELQRLSVPCANQSEYWDAPCDALGYSAAVFAMANGHSEIVEWLERRGATAHKAFTSQQAAQLMRKERERIQCHFFES